MGGVCYNTLGAQKFKQSWERKYCINYFAPPVNVALGAVTVLQATSITTDHLSGLSAV